MSDNYSFERMESEIQSWLGAIFEDRLEGQISVDIEGNSGKGDGFMGDILFATVKGNTKDQSPKNIDVVLKCSKKSVQFRKQMPVRLVFLNEITIYDEIFPAFRQFESEHGSKDPFNSVAKYYGQFLSPDREIIAFENLKKSGFQLWNRKLPFPKDYLRAVLQEYAKFHAISIAMQDQEPDRFRQLCGSVQDVFNLQSKAGNFDKIFRTNIDEICELLRGLVDDSAIEEWRNFKNFTDYVLNAPTEAPVKVIAHGDCWCTNFLFKSSENNAIIPAIIDWQMARVGSPILDLSYFLFCAISKEDISSIKDLLEEYYETFSNRLQQLGSSANLYSRAQFLSDWNQYSSLGLMMTNVIIKICLSEEHELADIKDTVDNDLDIADSFTQTLGNMEGYKQRMRYIIEYAVTEGLIRDLNKSLKNLKVFSMSKTATYRASCDWFIQYNTIKSRNHFQLQLVKCYL